ncbi:MAG: ChaN family lipoprotein [Hyphomicrobiaceae bacterium]
MGSIVLGFLGAALALFAGVTAMAGPADWRTAPWTGFLTRLEADNALVGRVWSIAEGREIAPDDLADRLGRARFVLVGEIHDNPDHHRLQAWLIDRIAAGGRRPAVVMEMIGAGKTEALAAYLARPDRSAAGLGMALDWAQSGWPDWPNYQPIAEAALGHDLAIRPGDAERDRIRAVSRGGRAAMSPEEARILPPDGVLPDGLRAVLSREVAEAHCDMLPEAAIPAMTLVQEFRDATLAASLLAADAAGRSGDGAVLIAGNGHVRADRAVPFHLVRSVPRGDIAVVALMEVTASEEDAAVYEPIDPEGRPAADYLWFTPRAERGDPCEEMREQMERMKAKGSGN